MPLAGVLLHWQVDERKNNSRSVPESEDSQLYNETKALASLRAQGSWVGLHASCRSVAALAGG